MWKYISIRHLPMSMSLEEFSEVLGEGNIHQVGFEFFKLSKAGRRYTCANVLSHLNRDELLDIFYFVNPIGQPLTVRERIFPYTGYVKRVWKENETNNFTIEFPSLDQSTTVDSEMLERYGVKDLALGQLIAANLFDIGHQPKISDAKTLFELKFLPRRGMDWAVYRDTASVARFDRKDFQKVDPISPATKSSLWTDVHILNNKWTPVFVNRVQSLTLKAETIDVNTPLLATLRVRDGITEVFSSTYKDHLDQGGFLDFLNMQEGYVKTFDPKKKRGRIKGNWGKDSNFEAETLNLSRLEYLRRGQRVYFTTKRGGTRNGSKVRFIGIV